MLLTAAFSSFAQMIKHFSSLLATSIYCKRYRDPVNGSLVSQEKVSEEAGWAAATYGQWERGERRPQERQAIIRLIQIFQRGNGLATVSEANDLLAAAEFAPLRADELSQIFSMAQPAPLPPPVSATTDPTIETIFDKFPDKEFNDQLRQGRRIRILTTWIPYLDMFWEALLAALQQGGRAEILMLHLQSIIAQFRSLDISMPNPPIKTRVQQGLHNNFMALANAAQILPAAQQPALQVRVYHALPSVLLYQVDEFCLAGFYFHGHMASYKPQLQVNLASALGQALQEEFDLLWKIGWPISNLANWQAEVEQTAKNIGT